MYTAVAEKPTVRSTSRWAATMAERLGYCAAELDQVPSDAIESFAGVGHFFHLAGSKPGERVVDLGSGSGMDTVRRIRSRSARPAGSSAST